MKRAVFVYGLLTVVIFIAGGFVSAAEEKIYSCHRLIEEPELDGRIKDDPVWKNIPDAGGFLKFKSAKKLASKQTSFRLGYTPEAFYMGIVCEEPDVEKIKTKFRDRDVNLCNEDSVEIFLLSEGIDYFNQYMVNADGYRWSHKIEKEYRPGEEIDLSSWEAKVYKGEDYYSIEVKLPFEVFLTIPQKGEVWTGNICRSICTSGDKHSTWAYMGMGYHEPYNFGKIIFDDTISADEGKKTKKRIIDALKKKTAVNLKSISGQRSMFAESAGKYPSLRESIASFLENYDNIEKRKSRLSTVKEARIVFKRSKALVEETKELQAKVLLENLFEE